MPADDSREAFVEQVYEKLRAIARRRLASERADHTLQATALVNEAFVKLNGDRQLTWQEKDSFFVAASEAMRRVLLDHARKKRSDRRGGGARPLPMDVVDLAVHSDSGWIEALDEALERLEAEDARAAKVVRLRFYCGLAVEETAAHLDASPRTIAREWAFARARLFQLLGRAEG
ncbi:MAG: ECF-type sigma factor [Planctomycetota bacterium JB042]